MLRQLRIEAGDVMVGDRADGVSVVSHTARITEQDDTVIIVTWDDGIETEYRYWESLDIERES
jgi:hypothetical protein